MRMVIKLFVIVLLATSLTCGVKYLVTGPLKQPPFEPKRDYTQEELSESCRYFDIELGTSWSKVVVQIMRKMKELERGFYEPSRRS